MASARSAPSDTRLSCGARKPKSRSNIAKRARSFSSKGAVNRESGKTRKARSEPGLKSPPGISAGQGGAPAAKPRMRIFRSSSTATHGCAGREKTTKRLATEAQRTQSGKAFGEPREDQGKPGATGRALDRLLRHRFWGNRDCGRQSTAKSGCPTNGKSPLQKAGATTTD